MKVAASWFLFIAIVMGLANASLAESELRTFTSREGKTINAKIIGATSTKVKLRRDDGNRFEADINIFSDADKEYIKKWVEEQVSKNINLEISNKINRGKTKRSSSGGIKYTSYNAYYNITIKNKSEFDLEDLNIKYTVVAFDKNPNAKGSEGKNKLTRGNFKTAIKSRSEASFNTKGVTLTESSLKSGYYWIEGGGKKNRDRLKGFILEIYKGDKLLEKYTYPETLKL